MKQHWYGTFGPGIGRVVSVKQRSATRTDGGASKRELCLRSAGEEIALHVPVPYAGTGTMMVLYYYTDGEEFQLL